METNNFYYINVAEVPRHFRQASSQQILGLTRTGSFCKVVSSDLAKFDSYQDAEAFLKNVKKNRSRANTRYSAAGKRYYQVRYYIAPEGPPVTDNAASSMQAFLDQNLLVNTLV